MNPRKTLRETAREGEGDGGRKDGPTVVVAIDRALSCFLLSLRVYRSSDFILNGCREREIMVPKQFCLALGVAEVQ